MAATAQRFDTLPAEMIVQIFVFLHPGDVFNGLLLRKSITLAAATSYPLCRVTLARLVARYNTRDDHGWDQKCKLLRHSPVFRWFPELEYETFDQRHVRCAASVLMTSPIVASNVDTFCADVLGNGALNRMSFCKMGLPADGAEKVLATLAQIQSLHSIRLRQIPELNVSCVQFSVGLQSLYLDQCDISQRVATDIIKRAPCLQVLNLSRNAVEGVDLIVGSMKELGSACMLKDLDLSHNCITDVSPLVNAFMLSTRLNLFGLRKLNLAFNLIDNVTPLHSLAWACREQTSVQFNYNPWKRQPVPPLT